MRLPISKAQKAGKDIGPEPPLECLRRVSRKGKIVSVADIFKKTNGASWPQPTVNKTKIHKENSRHEVRIQTKNVDLFEYLRL
jgi:hypothetical protein